MSESTPTEAGLSNKIARLIEERGWNQDEFARVSGLNRQTVRQIFFPPPDRRLRNATVSACARALGLSVHDLRNSPLEPLLHRVHMAPTAESGPNAQRLYEQATQPELLSWLERNPDRAAHFTPDEIDELLSVQGTGGPLTRVGVQHYVELIERKRKLIHQVHAIAGTEYLETLEKLVALMFEKIQPYRDRM